MPDLSTHALRVAVVSQAMSDPSFREELANDPNKTITSRLGKQPFDIKVIVDDKDDVSFLVPQRTEQLADMIDRSIKDIGNRPPTRSQFDSILIERAWRDAAFRQQLETNPQAAVDSLLKERGFSLTGKNVRVYQERAGECLIVVPAPVEDLSEEELEAVAGGCSTSAVVAAGSVLVAEYFCS